MKRLFFAALALTITCSSLLAAGGPVSTTTASSGKSTTVEAAKSLAELNRLMSENDDEENEVVELVGENEGGYSYCLEEGDREVEYEWQENEKGKRSASHEQDRKRCDERVYRLFLVGLDCWVHKFVYLISEHGDTCSESEHCGSYDDEL